MLRGSSTGVLGFAEHVADVMKAPISNNSLCGRLNFLLYATQYLIDINKSWAEQMGSSLAAGLASSSCVDLDGDGFMYIILGDNGMQRGIGWGGAVDYDVTVASNPVIPWSVLEATGWIKRFYKPETMRYKPRLSYDLTLVLEADSDGFNEHFLGSIVAPFLLCFKLPERLKIEHPTDAGVIDIVESLEAYLVATSRS
ncbi:hypothetical protein R3P38DRAFT_2805334 [Favolaschia claudopus]|uniref:Uncharacterized protein n=1 Tax=Favolaschia claudopus TaxID=2862362 RepID=A0AAV9ZNU3_9AGAR